MLSNKEVIYNSKLNIINNDNVIWHINNHMDYMFLRERTSCFIASFSKPNECLRHQKMNYLWRKQKINCILININTLKDFLYLNVGYLHLERLPMIKISLKLLKNRTILEISYKLTKYLLILKHSIFLSKSIKQDMSIKQTQLFIIKSNLDYKDIFFLRHTLSQSYLNLIFI